VPAAIDGGDADEFFDGVFAEAVFPAEIFGLGGQGGVLEPSLAWAGDCEVGDKTRLVMNATELPFRDEKPRA
jgi:hypothetical protein